MDKDSALQELKKFSYAIHPLPPEEWEAFSAIWQPYTAKRKFVLTAAGEIERHLYFVLKGVQRAFYQHEEKDSTIIFSYAFSFSGVVDSFLLQKPSRYYLETLTQSDFIRTTFNQVNELLIRYHAFETLIRKALSHTLAGVLERQIELQSFTAEQKFKTLLSRSPHVLQLIPHKYLASYLGIDAATFSKLLSTVRI
jgi:CRP-like cAMP-binding protein